MPSPSFTYTLTNGTTADASQVMQNFNDILQGVTDGSKDLSIAALTCAGTATLNGHVNLGNASGDDLTVTASLASSIPIKTTASFDIGSASLGLRALYFGANSQTVNIAGSGSMSATYTLTLPVNAGTNGYVLSTNGSGVTSWVRNLISTSAQSADYTVLDTDGVRTILMTTGGTDRTVTLPTAADNTHRIITVKKVDSGTGKCTVDGESTETIDGAATLILFKQYESVTLQCNGTGWDIIDFKGFSVRYTPDNGGVANSNIDSVTYGSAIAVRVAPDMVHVAGQITANITATSTLTTINASLPVASNLGASDLWGTMSVLDDSLDLQQGYVNASAANDVARLQFRGADATNAIEIAYTFLYQII